MVEVLVERLCYRRDSGHGPGSIPGCVIPPTPNAHWHPSERVAGALWHEPSQVRNLHRTPELLSVPTVEPCEDCHIE